MKIPWNGNQITNETCLKIQASEIQSQRNTQIEMLKTKHNHEIESIFCCFLPHTPPPNPASLFGCGQF